MVLFFSRFFICALMVLWVFGALHSSVFAQESDKQESDIQELDKQVSDKQDLGILEARSVVSEGGIEGWLVEDHSRPIISLRFAFRGGTASDPAGRLGLARFLSSILDEGAGDMPARIFQENLRRYGVRLSFSASAEHFFVFFQCLTPYIDESFELLRLALSSPRFDSDAIERIRSQMLTSLAFDEKDPASIAMKKWRRWSFPFSSPSHIYGRSADGEKADIEAITASDLRDLWVRLFAREDFHIVGVGDIDADEFSSRLDSVFSFLPASSGISPLPAPDDMREGFLTIHEEDIPQSVVRFGHRGIGWDDSRLFPSIVMNQILSGGFGSRLYDVVRDRLGLSYYVFTSFNSYHEGGIFIGGAATANDRVMPLIRALRDALEDFVLEGPTLSELSDAKRYLTGAYPLRFDSGSNIARQYLFAKIRGWGIDYPRRRNDLIEAVTLSDLRQAASTLLRPESLSFTVVGRPIGVTGVLIPRIAR